MTDDDSVTTTVPANPAIALDKTASAIADNDSNGPDAGDTITYTFKVTNTGNVPLNPVSVTDPKVGTVTCSPSSLAPGAFVNCTAAPYVLHPGRRERRQGRQHRDRDRQAADGQQRHRDRHGLGPRPDCCPRSTSTRSRVRSSDNDSNGADAGDTITYTFKVTNTGNVPLNPVSVTDPKVGTVTCSPNSLAPGAFVNCTAAPYVLTQWPT